MFVPFLCYTGIRYYIHKTIATRMSVVIGGNSLENKELTFPTDPEVRIYD